MLDERGSGRNRGGNLAPFPRGSALGEQVTKSADLV